MREHTPEQRTVVGLNHLLDTAGQAFNYHQITFRAISLSIEIPRSTTPVTPAGLVS